MCRTPLVLSLLRFRSYVSRSVLCLLLRVSMQLAPIVRLSTFRVSLTVPLKARILLTRFSWHRSSVVVVHCLVLLTLAGTPSSTAVSVLLDIRYWASLRRILCRPAARSRRLRLQALCTLLDRLVGSSLISLLAPLMVVLSWFSLSLARVRCVDSLVLTPLITVVAPRVLIAVPLAVAVGVRVVCRRAATLCNIRWAPVLALGSLILHLLVKVVWPVLPVVPGANRPTAPSASRLLRIVGPLSRITGVALRTAVNLSAAFAILGRIALRAVVVGRWAFVVVLLGARRTVAFGLRVCILLRNVRCVCLTRFLQHVCPIPFITSVLLLPVPVSFAFIVLFKVLDVLFARLSLSVARKALSPNRLVVALSLFSAVLTVPLVQALIKVRTVPLMLLETVPVIVGHCRVSALLVVMSCITLVSPFVSAPPVQLSFTAPVRLVVFISPTV